VSDGEQIRKAILELRKLCAESDTLSCSEPVSKLRTAADRLYYMAKENSDGITSTLRKVLEDLDAAVQTAGGADSKWGRRVMDLARKLDGFEVSTALELRSVVEGFARPSSLHFVCSLPAFPEKKVTSLMTDLYDLADEMSGVTDD
jgi:hypothetical protein